MKLLHQGSSRRPGRSIRFRMKEQSIITVLSGKGGTGKTIIAANLASVIAEDYNVLLIDFDYYVRSLTTLLTSFQKHLSGAKREIDWWKVFIDSNLEGKMLKTDIIEALDNISDYLITIRKGKRSYGTIALLPSYYEKCRRLNWVDVQPLPFSDLDRRVKLLFQNIPKEYEFVVIDTRAGSTELSLASCLNSDYSVIVMEQDKISFDATMYLISQIQHLQARYDSTIVYFLALNKVERSIDSSKLKGIEEALEPFNLSFVCRYSPEIYETYSVGKK